MSYKLLWLWGCKVTRLQGWLHCALVFLERLTNVAQQLAADIEFSGLFIGHHPFAGGHDHGAKAIDDTWSFNGTCEVENHGTYPDIEVVLDPALWREGHDPQLERAVAERVILLEKAPKSTIKKPAYPNKTKIPPQG